MTVLPVEVRIRRRGIARVRAGHPWVFRDDLVGDASAGNGDIVRVAGERGEPLGYAFHSAVSLIALRMIAGPGSPPDETFWDARVAAALGHRALVVTDSDASRLLFGESDGIPGLVLDRYGPHLVVQLLTAGAERVAGQVLRSVMNRIEVQSVLERNDPSVRTLEGLPRKIEQREGHTPPDIEVREGPVRYRVDPWKGQKTGAFLDQRENRLAAASYSRGRVLDVFSYHGCFALHAALRAEEVIAIDASGEAVARGATNASLNGLRNVSFVEANAFDELRARQRRGERFDAIFLDPPAFAKNRASLEAARRGYKEINLRAMQLLAPGGVLVTSSCSYNLSEADFLDLLAAAAADARIRFHLLETRAQARDHPVRLGFPESHYLKCLLLRPL